MKPDFKNINIKTAQPSGKPESAWWGVKNVAMLQKNGRSFSYPVRDSILVENECYVLSDVPLSLPSPRGTQENHVPNRTLTTLLISQRLTSRMKIQYCIIAIQKTAKNLDCHGNGNLAVLNTSRKDKTIFLINNNFQQKNQK